MFGIRVCCGEQQAFADSEQQAFADSRMRSCRGCCDKTELSQSAFSTQQAFWSLGASTPEETAPPTPPRRLLPEPTYGEKNPNPHTQGTNFNEMLLSFSASAGQLFVVVVVACTYTFCHLCVLRAVLFN